MRDNVACVSKVSLVLGFIPSFRVWTVTILLHLFPLARPVWIQIKSPSFFTSSPYLFFPFFFSPLDFVAIVRNETKDRFFNSVRETLVFPGPGKARFNQRFHPLVRINFLMDNAATPNAHNPLLFFFSMNNTCSRMCMVTIRILKYKATHVTQPSSEASKKFIRWNSNASGRRVNVFASEAMAFWRF